MNPEDRPGQDAYARLHPALVAAMTAEREPHAEAAAGAVEAEWSMLATHQDPSLAGPAASDLDGPEPEAVDAAGSPEARQRAQVRWVRPTELFAQGGARASGWGLDLRAELFRRMRAVSDHHGQAVHASSGRKGRLPDLSITGRRTAPGSRVPDRPGMGMR